ncbi:MAG: hypothetical protein HJJLKODD_00568 [Phycisphaerae bacterium]|nr:hypothetical protein [Phycisphaerae bacterium]
MNDLWLLSNQYSVMVITSIIVSCVSVLCIWFGSILKDKLFFYIVSDLHQIVDYSQRQKILNNTLYNLNMLGSSSNIINVLLLSGLCVFCFLTRRHVILVGALLLLLAGPSTIVFLFRKNFQHAARAELNKLGFSVCIQCGYDLTGLTSAICPECGTRCKGYSSKNNSA